MRQSASPGTAPDDLRLVDGSRVAVIGGGPGLSVEVVRLTAALGEGGGE